MLLGFDNEFVLSEIFGEDDVFTGAAIDNINYQPLGFNMKMDVLTKCNVKNSPPKWKAWDIVCLNIELFGVKEFQAKINHELLHSEVFTISKDETMYVLEILGSNKSRVFCKFGGGRIQRIVPMKYNDEFKGYEKA
ncbi:Imm50 family immunity protein [Lacrimispora indolis]|uniref:Imm50 family immunity protein n=1 Tax=Lacrimispora indolis TaxID=69825 RepID=UPI000421A2DD|nr:MULTISPECIES: Imm50 family immunity protein [Lachnospiraceae]